MIYGKSIDVYGEQIQTLVHPIGPSWVRCVGSMSRASLSVLCLVDSELTLKLKKGTLPVCKYHLESLGTSPTRTTFNQWQIGTRVA